MCAKISLKTSKTLIGDLVLTTSLKFEQSSIIGQEVYLSVIQNTLSI